MNEKNSYQDYREKMVCLANDMVDRAAEILQEPDFSEDDLEFLQLTGEMAESVWRLYN